MIRAVTGTFPCERIEGYCVECQRMVTQDGLGPEVGHAEDCCWTMHDGISSPSDGKEGL